LRSNVLHRTAAMPNKPWVDNRPSASQFHHLRFPTAAAPPHLTLCEK
jgi:hypothetical protein